MPVQQFGELLSDPKKLILHLLKVIAISLGLALLAMFFLDQQLSMYFEDRDVKGLLWHPARILTDAALSEYYFVGSLLIWAFCKWIGPRWNNLKSHLDRVDYYRRWALNFFVALLVCGVITHIIKFSVGRQRPHKSPDFDPFVFTPGTTHWHWHSFSSGHSQVIFTVCTMMSVAFPKYRWFWIPLAIVIAATRVVVHDHFLSDIIVGASVGYVGTLLALQLMRKKTKNGLY